MNIFNKAKDFFAAKPIFNKKSFVLGQRYPKVDTRGFFDPNQFSSITSPLQYNSDDAVPTAEACVALLSETISRLPIMVVQKGSPYEIIEDHPVSEMFLTPSREFGPFTTRQVISSLHHTSGNGVAEIIRDGQGKPVNLLPRILVDTKRFPNGELRYSLRNPYTNQNYELPPSQVFHIMGPGIDVQYRKALSPVVKYASILALQSESVGRQRRSMKGLELRHILEANPNVTYTPKQQQEILTAFLGSNEKGSVVDSTMALLMKKGFASLPVGFSLKNIGFSSVDLQLLDVLGFSSAEVCRIWRVPPALVHVTLPGGQSLKQHPSLSEQWTGFVRGTLAGHISRWKEEIERKLFTIEDRQQYEILIDVDQLTMGTLRDLATSLDLLVQKTAVLTVNEARRRYLKLPGLPGGDVLRQPTGAPPQTQMESNE